MNVAEPRTQTALPASTAAVRPQGRPVTRCLLFSTTFLTVYLLLLGPLAAVHRKVELPPLRRTLEILYAPAIFCIEKDIRPVSSGLKWYVGLFR